MSRLDAQRVAVVAAALADGRSDTLRHDTTVLVDSGRIAGIWPDGTGPDPGDLGAAAIDGSGATIVPGLVDSHAHLSMPGGAQWVQRGFDPASDLLDTGEDNGALMVRAGIRWARDVGAPRGADGRALSLTLRDRWSGVPDRPYVRAAGTWISRGGSLPHGLAIEVEHGADLVAAVGAELDAGADLVKLYLDGPDADAAPFSVEEVRAAVGLAHGRGARVAAHSSVLAGAQVGAHAGIDSIEHGFALDADTAAALAANGVTLVSTLAVLHSWQGFGHTTRIDRFAGDGASTVCCSRTAPALR
jgi:imidazolonepropionase-like amidohydrolase